MEFIRGLPRIHPRHHGCVATLGKFDGVHRGHQAILQLLREQAAAHGLPALVITFEPQPEEYFAPTAPARLTRLREKLIALREQQVDRVLCLRFDEGFAHQSATQFIEDLLVAKLGIRYLIVGRDFHFGHQRQGNFSLLREAGEQQGFEVRAMPTVEEGGERISSSRIRAALGQGDLPQAAFLLGRPYQLQGRVAHGRKLGRQLGFPTANIFLHRQNAPLTGVFAVRMHGVSDQPWPGVANLGFRPSVDQLQKLLLEVHCFDFSGDLYGRYVAVEFVEKLRGEQKFPSLDALRTQIQADCDQARARLGA